MSFGSRLYSSVVATLLNCGLLWLVVAPTFHISPGFWQGLGIVVMYEIFGELVVKHVR